jgi:hypothetical protein
VKSEGGPAWARLCIIFNGPQKSFMEKTYTSLAEEKETKPNIADLAGDYIDTCYKLALVKINQKTADISAVASFSMLAGLVCLFVGIFLGIAASLWLGGLLQSNALGFLLVGIFFLVVFLVVFLTRKKVFYPFIKNLVIKSIYE